MFLGVVPDDHFSWKCQIQNVARKVSKSVGIIYKSSFCLNTTSLCTLYCSLVYPYVHYRASAWGSIYQSNLKRLINLQKRVIRIVSRSSFDAHANPIFVSLRILKFEDIIKLQIGKVMYLYKNGFLPNSFNDMFSLNCDVHSYNTRSKNSFRLPYCRTNVRKFSLRFQGPKIFNSLSPEIPNASSTALFNSKLKSFFFWYKHTIALLMLVCRFSLLSLFFFCHLFLHYFFSPFLSLFCTYTFSLVYFYPT